MKQNLIAIIKIFFLTLFAGQICAATMLPEDLSAEAVKGKYSVQGSYLSGNLTFLRPPTGREAKAAEWCPDCGNTAAGRDVKRVGQVYFRRMPHAKAEKWCESIGSRLATVDEVSEHLIPTVGTYGNGVWESELNWPQQNQLYWTADAVNEDSHKAFITKDYTSGEDVYSFRTRDSSSPLWPLCVVNAATPGATPQRLNFLHIIVDDLRAEGLAMYGDSAMITPNLDKLSAQGTVFKRAYVNIPTCGASRASMFSGLYGKRDRFVEYTARLDKEVPNTITLPGYLKKNGYLTLSYGKVIHAKGDSDHAWSATPWTPSTQLYANPKNRISKLRETCKKTGICDPANNGRAPAYEIEDVTDTVYHDGQVAAAAVTALETIVGSGMEDPFYMAVGFYKPHLPFTAPKRYWDLYERAEVKVSPMQRKPDNAPPGAWHNSGEIRNWYTGIPKVPEPWTQNISEAETRSLTHGYYAAVSYTDAQIGKVLEALDKLGLSKNTIVIVSSDHGFSLGDHTLWNKHSLFKIATKVPLIVSGPKVEQNATVSGVAEYVDIYPTIVELADLKLPTHLHGKSFKANLQDTTLPTKPAVYPRYTRGDNVTTEKYSYSAYFGNNGAKDRNRMTGHMLYDYKMDPLEERNLVDDPSYHDTVERLQKLLVAHIREHDSARNKHPFVLLKPKKSIRTLER